MAMIVPMSRVLQLAEIALSRAIPNLQDATTYRSAEFLDSTRVRIPSDACDLYTPGR